MNFSYSDDDALFDKVSQCVECLRQVCIEK